MTSDASAATPLYHLATRSAWEFHSQGADYFAASLHTEGFIHCCGDVAQALAAADRFFAPDPAEPLLLWELDPTQLDAEVRWERAGNGGVYPHIYGPVPHAAVVRTIELRHEGRWTTGELMGIDAKLAELGIVLPTPPASLAAYVGAVLTGKLLVTAGQLPTIDGKLIATGKVPTNTDAAAAKAAARVCAINCLAQAKAVLGTLDRIVRIVRLEGYVNSAPGFTAHAVVMNGASDLMLELFGDAGKHARTTVGVAELPLDAAIEVGLWAEVD